LPENVAPLHVDLSHASQARSSSGSMLALPSLSVQSPE